MSRLTAKLMIMLAAACLLFAFSPALASGPSVNHAYPPMPAGAFAGNVTGRVTISGTGNGFSGASVALVKADDSYTVYAAGVTNQSGYYAFTGVNSTGGAASYRIMVTSDGYDDNYADPFAVPSADNVSIPVIAMIASAAPTSSPTPPPYGVSSGSGHVSGRIKMQDGEGAAGVTVTVVNENNFDYTYGSATTDSGGYYDIDTTAVSASPVFQLFLHKSGFLDACSLPFSLTSGASVTINVDDNSIFPTPPPTPTPTPTPVPGTTPKPTTTPTPGPTTKPTSTPVPTSVGLMNTPTPGPSGKPATPVPAVAAPTSVPGFEILLALAGLAGALVCRKLK